MKNQQRTRDLIQLGGLVRLSGLDRKIKDPATLLGLLIRLKGELKDLNSDVFHSAKETGINIMTSKSRAHPKPIDTKPGDDTGVIVEYSHLSHLNG